MSNAKARLVRPLHAVALATGLSAWLAHRKPVRRIVMLHGVGVGGDLSATDFEAGLAWLAKRFNIVPLDHVVRAMADRRTPDPAGELALTFDDGLHNQFEVAYPVLKRLGLPATYFVCPELIENHRWLWNHEARSRLTRLSRSLRAEFARTCGAAADDVESLVDLMKTLPLSRRLEEEQRLRALTPGFEFTQEEHFRFDPLSWDDIEQLDRSLITIGSHTMSHPILPTLDDATLARELTESRQMLEHRLNRTVDLFCYPNGANDRRVRDAVGRVYRAAVTTEYGFASERADPHRLQRIPVTPSLALMAWRMHRPRA
jgi:peptidoglycan/xylan/chitin deacetylase (PgdA/CDA1 family)